MSEKPRPNSTPPRGGRGVTFTQPKTPRNTRGPVPAFRVVLATVAILGPAVEVAGAAEPAADSVASSNVATRWVARMLDAVRSRNPAIHTSTPGAARTYALTTLAMYDAVNGFQSAAGRSTGDRALVPSYAAAPASGDPRAAVSAAAHAVLSSLFSENSLVKDRVESAHSDELAALGPDPSVEVGRAWALRLATRSCRYERATEPRPRSHQNQDAVAQACSRGHSPARSSATWRRSGSSRPTPTARTGRPS